LRGLNFTTGKDLLSEVRKVIASKVNYVGGLPRQEGETLAAFFRRVCSLCPGRRGIIFSCPEFRAAEQATAMKTWHAAQQEVFD
jgi:hypothetical protein